MFQELLDLPESTEFQDLKDHQELRVPWDQLGHSDPMDHLVLQDSLGLVGYLAWEDLLDLRDLWVRQVLMVRLVKSDLREEMVRLELQVQQDPPGSAVVQDHQDLLVRLDH